MYWIKGKMNEGKTQCHKTSYCNDLILKHTQNRTNEGPQKISIICLLNIIIINYRVIISKVSVPRQV